MSLSISVKLIFGAKHEEADDDDGAERVAEAEDEVGEPAAHRAPCSSCAAAEVVLGQADVVADRGGRQLGAGLVALVGDHQVERPSRCRRRARGGVTSKTLARSSRAVEDVGVHDDEPVLEDQADRARKVGVPVPGARLERPGGVRASRRAPSTSRSRRRTRRCSRRRRGRRCPRSSGRCRRSSPASPGRRCGGRGRAPAGRGSARRRRRGVPRPGTTVSLMSLG